MYHSSFIEMCSFCLSEDSLHSEDKPKTLDLVHHITVRHIVGIWKELRLQLRIKEKAIWPIEDQPMTVAFSSSFLLLCMKRQ